jgi:hypothetical protein
LEVVNRAVALDNSLGRKTGLLKVSVDIRGEHEIAVRFGPADFEQPAEPGVWDGVSIKVKPVPIERPRQCRVVAEPCWIRHFLAGKAAVDIHPPSSARKRRKC